MWKENILVRADVLAGLPERIDLLGGQSHRMMREAGVDPNDLKVNQKYVCWLSFNRFLANAAAELKAPDFGLQWVGGHRLVLNNFGPVVVLLLVSKDVRTFIQSWIDYDRIHTTGSYSQVVEGPEHGLDSNTARIIVRYSPAAPDSRQLKEACILVFYNLLMKYSGLPNPVKEVGFPHKPMSDVETYKEYFDCPLKFNTPYLYLDFSAPILEKKIGPTFNPGKRLFSSHVEKKLRNSPAGRVSISAKIGLMLPQVLGIGSSDVETVANILGVSPRKMQRLLQDEGSTYSGILDDVRKNMATQLLQHSDCAIARIAELLDYKSPVAFTTACKRWTGMSPREYRISLRKDKLPI